MGFSLFGAGYPSRGIPIREPKIGGKCCSEGKVGQHMVPVSAVSTRGMLVHIVTEPGVTSLEGAKTIIFSTFSVCRGPGTGPKGFSRP